ncbi:hypothetical protein DIPPA_02694 [Diplonema papillatum]|nr:hypothetical protein DIPPA_02694 [Diplonema papillatum]
MSALPVVFAACFATSGSVLWRWWETEAGCEEDIKDLQQHIEWTSGDNCLNTGDLQPEDPVARLAKGFTDVPTDLQVLCIDQESDSNYNAMDDTVVVRFFPSSGSACEGEPRGSVLLNNSLCGQTIEVNGLLVDIRLSQFTCSRCTWLFLREAPPPYFFQAIGILVFLVLCIIINFCLQDHVDRYMKILPPKLCPCMEKPVEERGDELFPGVTVRVVVRRLQQSSKDGAAKKGKAFSGDGGYEIQLTLPQRDDDLGNSIRSQSPRAGGGRVAAGVGTALPWAGTSAKFKPPRDPVFPRSPKSGGGGRGDGAPHNLQNPTPTLSLPPLRSPRRRDRALTDFQKSHSDVFDRQSIGSPGSLRGPLSPVTLDSPEASRGLNRQPTTPTTIAAARQPRSPAADAYRLPDYTPPPHGHGLNTSYSSVSGRGIASPVDLTPLEQFPGTSGRPNALGRRKKASTPSTPAMDTPTGDFLPFSPTDPFTGRAAELLSTSLRRVTAADDDDRPALHPLSPPLINTGAGDGLTSLQHIPTPDEPTNPLVVPQAAKPAAAAARLPRVRSQTGVIVDGRVRGEGGGAGVKPPPQAFRRADGGARRPAAMSLRGAEALAYARGSRSNGSSFSPRAFSDGGDDAGDEDDDDEESDGNDASADRWVDSPSVPLARASPRSFAPRPREAAVSDYYVEHAAAAPAAPRLPRKETAGTKTLRSREEDLMRVSSNIHDVEHAAAAPAAPRLPRKETAGTKTLRSREEDLMRVSSNIHERQAAPEPEANTPPRPRHLRSLRASVAPWGVGVKPPFSRPFAECRTSSSGADWRSGNGRAAAETAPARRRARSRSPSLRVSRVSSCAAAPGNGGRRGGGTARRGSLAAGEARARRQQQPRRRARSHSPSYSCVSCSGRHTRPARRRRRDEAEGVLLRAGYDVNATSHRLFPPLSNPVEVLRAGHDVYGTTSSLQSPVSNPVDDLRDVHGTMSSLWSPLSNPVEDLRAGYDVSSILQSPVSNPVDDLRADYDLHGTMSSLRSPLSHPGEDLRAGYDVYGTTSILQSPVSNPVEDLRADYDVHGTMSSLRSPLSNPLEDFCGDYDVHDTMPSLLSPLSNPVEDLRADYEVHGTMSSLRSPGRLFSSFNKPSHQPFVDYHSAYNQEYTSENDLSRSLFLDHSDTLSNKHPPATPTAADCIPNTSGNSESSRNADSKLDLCATLKFPEAAEGFTKDAPFDENETTMCIVCGKEGTVGENRGNGFKCSKCVGRSHNPLLTRAEQAFDRKLAKLAVEGRFGKFAEVVGTKTKGSQKYALVTFRHVSAWMRCAALAKLKDANVIGPLWADDAPPTLYVEDESEEAKWLSLCRSCDFIVTHEGDGTWRAVTMRQPVVVWLLDSDVVKIADYGGPFVRVAEKTELRRQCGEEFQSWWKDFELCVGEVLRVEGDESTQNDNPRVVIAFQGSATLSFPLSALRACTRDEHDSEFLITPQKVEKRPMMAAFVASAPPLLAAKGLFLTIFFIISVATALSEGHSGSAKRHGAWEAYEEVYFKLFNSGYPTLMADTGSVTLYFLHSFKPTFAQFIAGVGRPVVVTLGLSMLISLPGIITHALPMVVYYGWLWLPLGLITRYCIRVIDNFAPVAPVVDRAHEYDMSYFLRRHKGYLAKAGCFYLFFRFIAELLAVLFIQTNFNYAIYAYENEGYLSTIVDEFNSRQVACTLEMGLKMASLVW